MTITRITLASLVLAATPLAGCASKPVVKAAGVPEYSGPRIVLRAAPGPAASAIFASVAHPTAIAWLNARRAEVGLPVIAEDESVAAAAAEHAHYLELNRASGHDEFGGKPGFTGIDVTSRVRLHTESVGASEVLAVYGGPRAPDLPIEEIFDSPYHRGAIFFDWQRGGEGIAVGNSAVTVVDFSDIAPSLKETELVAYPFDGDATSPTSWVNTEVPDPMGGQSQYRGQTLGYPITLSGGPNAHIELEEFDLRDARGKKVACHIAALTPADAARSTGICTPFEPLHSGMRYSVHATGHLTQTYGISHAPFDVTWSFTTAAKSHRSGALLAQQPTR